MFCRSISHNPRSCFALFVILIDVRTQKFSWVVLLVLVRWLGLLGNVKYHNGIGVDVGVGVGDSADDGLHADVAGDIPKPAYLDPAKVVRFYRMSCCLTQPC